VTFNAAWVVNAPMCMTNNETQILFTRAVTTTTTMTISSALSIDADVISYQCLGRE
jgi:hypothetical protein